jgi:hypothetical protein
VAVATAARKHRPTPQERATASTQHAFSRKAGRLRLRAQKDRPANMRMRMSMPICHLSNLDAELPITWFARYRHYILLHGAKSFRRFFQRFALLLVKLPRWGGTYTLHVWPHPPNQRPLAAVGGANKLENTLQIVSHGTFLVLKCWCNEAFCLSAAAPPGNTETCALDTRADSCAAGPPLNVPSAW